jgi:hypothetical protein
MTHEQGLCHLWEKYRLNARKHAFSMFQLSDNDNNLMKKIMFSNQAAFHALRNANETNILWYGARKLLCPLAGQGFTEHIPVAISRCHCWMANSWNMFPQQWIRLKKQCMAYRVMSIPRQHIQKHFCSHGSEPPKHSNSKEHDNSTDEGGDLHMFWEKPTSERELTNRRHNITEHRRGCEKKSEVKSLFYVVYSQ